MPNPNRRGIKDIIKATQWSMQGIRAAIKHEASFRLELKLVLVMTPLAVWLAQSMVQFWMLLTPLLLVLIVEILNSAIEAVVDLVCGEERHELAARAKDMGSAAVFFTLLLTAFSWFVVLYQNYA